MIRWREIGQPFMKSGHKYIKCMCTCGVVKDVNLSNLRSGKTKGCSKCKQPYIKHGMAGTAEYKAWSKMKIRCYSTSYHEYHYYGGRGVEVCQRWLESFENFYEDMGKRPSINHSLDRINVEGNYTKDNCRWADKTTQSFNRRKRSDNTSGTVGVYEVPRGYVARISKGNTEYYLGLFKNIDDAITTRKEAELKYYESEERGMNDQ